MIIQLQFLKNILTILKSLYFNASFDWKREVKYATYTSSEWSVYICWLVPAKTGQHHLKWIYHDAYNETFTKMEGKEASSSTCPQF